MIRQMDARRRERSSMECDHNVIRQLTSKLAVAESRPPRTEMDFVGAHRLVHRVARRAGIQSSSPQVMRSAAAPRCRTRAGRRSVTAVGAVHAELVPDRRWWAQSHTPGGPSTRMGASWPFQPLNSPIKLTPLGVERPHSILTTPSAVVNRRGWAPRTPKAVRGDLGLNRCRSTS